MRSPRTDLAREALRPRRTLRVAITGLAALLVTPASASASPEVASLRPLLVAAIDAPDGRAAGALAGPLAEVLRSRGVSATPLLVEVTTLTIYRQPGCRRLNVRFQQRDVTINNAPPVDRELALQLNYCRDGQAPRSLE
jgi:hypothetical protein